MIIGGGSAGCAMAACVADAGFSVLLLEGGKSDRDIRLLNFGLFGAVFTADRVSAYRVARGTRTGTVCHNAFRFDPYLPFGGYKQSGVGREGGAAGVDAYTEIKSILLDGPAGAA